MTLLNEYIEQVIMTLYPNMNKKAVSFDPTTGKLNQGPVVLKVDAGPGRMVSPEFSVIRVETRTALRMWTHHHHGLTECD